MTALAVVPVACRPAAHQPTVTEPAPPPPEIVRVVTSTPLIAELVRRVGGSGVEVDSLTGIDEPATALQRTGPIESQLVASDLVVVLGFGQEAALAESLARATQEGTLVCELAAGLPSDQLLPRLDDPSSTDPHVWLDPLLWKEATLPIEAALTKLRPLVAEQWRRSGHAVRFELEETARLMKRLAETELPIEPGPIRTTQPGLRYLARAVGLELEVVSDPAALPPKDELETLPLDLLRAPGVTAIATIHEHDLGTVDGLRAYALDLMLKRRQ